MTDNFNPSDWELVDASEVTEAPEAPEGTTFKSNTVPDISWQTQPYGAEGYGMRAEYMDRLNPVAEMFHNIYNRPLRLISGYRPKWRENQIWNSGVRPSVPPWGTSRHTGWGYGAEAVDVHPDDIADLNRLPLAEMGFETLGNINDPGHLQLIRKMGAAEKVAAAEKPFNPADWELVDDTKEEKPFNPDDWELVDADTVEAAPEKVLPKTEDPHKYLTEAAKGIPGLAQWSDKQWEATKRGFWGSASRFAGPFLSNLVDRAADLVDVGPDTTAHGGEWIEQPEQLPMAKGFAETYLKKQYPDWAGAIEAPEQGEARKLVRPLSDYLREQARLMAPTGQSEGFAEKLAEGVGSLPITLAKYGIATSLLGPILGMVAVDLVESSDKSPMEIFQAGVGALALGGVLKGAGFLKPASQMATVGTMFGIMSWLHGGDIQDIFASTSLGGTLALTAGHTGNLSARQAITEGWQDFSRSFGAKSIVGQVDLLRSFLNNIKSGRAPIENVDSFNGAATTMADFARSNIPHLNGIVEHAKDVMWDTQVLADSKYYDGSFDLPERGGLRGAKDSRRYEEDPVYRAKVDTVIDRVANDALDAFKKAKLLEDAISEETEFALRGKPKPAEKTLGGGGPDTTEWFKEIGEDIRLAVEKVRGGYNIDPTRAWNNEAKNKYGKWRLGDIGIRETLQNSADAVIEALRLGEIKKGKIDLGVTDNLKGYWCDDNGIGMSDTDIAGKFLTLYGSGKDNQRSAGGFGIAKAVILAPHETATWTLHSRDNWFTHEMANEREKIGSKKARRGSRIEVNTNTTDIFSPKARWFAETSEFPKNVEVTWKGQKLDDIFKGVRHKVEFDGEVFPGTTARILYFPKGLPGINEYTISRLNFPTGLKLTQSITPIYRSEFKGSFLVDIVTDRTPGKPGYPWTDSRNTLQDEIAAKIERLAERYSIDTTSASRAGVESKRSTAEKVNATFRKSATKAAKEPTVTKIVDSFRDRYEVDVTPIDQMDVRTDEGKVPEKMSPEVARLGAGMETVLRLVAKKVSLPVGRFYLRAVKIIDGMTIAGEFDKGDFGWNYENAPPEAFINPVDCYQYLRQLVEHELAHHYQGPHNEKFMQAHAYIMRQGDAELMGQILTIAEDITGIVAKDVRARLAASETMSQIVSMLTPEQRDLFDMKQGGTDYGFNAELFYPGGRRPALEQILPGSRPEGPLEPGVGKKVLHEARDPGELPLWNSPEGASIGGVRTGEPTPEAKDISNRIKEQMPTEETPEKRYGGGPDTMDFFREIADWITGRENVDSREKARVLKTIPFFHTPADLAKIAAGEGTIKLYHGAPASYANSIVDRVARGDYKTQFWNSADDMLHYVAKLYDIPYTVLRERTGAGHLVDSYSGDKVGRMSTAPAEVASRWATSFPYGEIMSELNNYARLYREAERQGVDFDTFYEEVGNRVPGTTLSMADRIGLPDLLADQRKGGSLIELEVDARALLDSTKARARSLLRYASERGLKDSDIGLAWNFDYKDIKVHPSNIKSAKVVVDLTPETKYEVPYERPTEEDRIELGRYELARRKGVDPDKLTYIGTMKTMPGSPDLLQYDYELAPGESTTWSSKKLYSIGPDTREYFETQIPIWRSKISDFLTVKLRGKVPAKTLARDLENWANKGAQVRYNSLNLSIPKEELKWSGILPWLKSQGTITKDDVLQFLRDDDAFQIDVVEKRQGILHGPDVLDQTSFGNWMRIPPGGDRYREFYLTVPPNREVPYQFKPDVETLLVGGEGLPAPEGMFKVPPSHAIGDKAADINRFAHFFADDRILSDGKYLMGWEMQFEWARRGSKRGFISSEAVEQAKAKIAEHHDAARLLRIEASKIGDEIRASKDRGAVPSTSKMADHMELVRRAKEIQDKAFDLEENLRKQKETAVPEFPFMTNSMEVTLKKVIRQAAAEGYDGILLATGDIVKDRYDLRNYVDEIRYYKQPDGRFTFETYKDALPIEELAAADMPAEKLEQWLGKSIAEKMIRNEGYDAAVGYESGKSLIGEDLAVGGEWTDQLYDKMGAGFLKKFGKQWGAKLELTREIPFEREGEDIPLDRPVYKLKFTDPMRTAALKGDMYLFGGGPDTSSWFSDVWSSITESRVARGSAIDFEAIADKASKVWDHLRGVPAEWTPYKSIVNTYLGDRQIAGRENQVLLARLIRAVPDKSQREAITNWIEAGGDTKLLIARANHTADPKLKRGYQLAANLPPEAMTVANEIVGLFDIMLKEGQAAGIINSAYDNYINHIWKKGNPVTRSLKAELNAGMLNTNFSYARKRIWSTYFEGEQMGRIPKNKDAAYLLGRYFQSFYEAIAARRAVRDITHAENARDGLPLTTVAGRGTPVPPVAPEESAAFEDVPGSYDMTSRPGVEIGKDKDGNPVYSEGPEAYIIRPRAVTEEQLNNYVRLDHPALRKWKWLANDWDGKPILMEGDLLVHKDIARKVSIGGEPSLRNILARSAVREHPIGRPFMAGLQSMKATLLSASPFHQVHVATHGMMHMVNIADLPEIDFNVPLQRELVRHGLMVHDPKGMVEFAEGVYGMGSGLLSKIPYLGRGLDAYGRYLFEGYIPRLKMKLATEAYERNMRRYEGKYNRDQILEMTSWQANAAFGELNYKAMGRNPTVQDFFRIFGLAPDFLEARFRFAGQALRPGGKEQFYALMRGASALYLMGVIGSKLLSDDKKWHFDSPFTVVWGKREYRLRSVPGDILHLYDNPRNFVYWRLNPTTVRTFMEMTTGRDIFGRKRDFVDQVKDFFTTHVPIPLQPFMPSLRKETDWFDGLLRTLGISSHKYRTAADQVMLDYFMEYRIDRPARSELLAVQDARRKVLKYVREGDIKSAAGAIKDVSKHYTVDPKKMLKWIEEAQYPENIANFRNVPLEVMAKCLNVAEPEEEKVFLPIFLDKLDRASPERLRMAKPEIDKFIDKLHNRKHHKSKVMSTLEALGSYFGPEGSSGQ